DPASSRLDTPDRVTSPDPTSSPPIIRWTSPRLTRGNPSGTTARFFRFGLLAGGLYRRGRAPRRDARFGLRRRARRRRSSFRRRRDDVRFRYGRRGGNRGRRRRGGGRIHPPLQIVDHIPDFLESLHIVIGNGQVEFLLDPEHQLDRVQRI